MANLAILQSIRMIFKNSSTFLEKGNVYLCAINIFRQLNDIKMIEDVEKMILMAIRNKTAIGGWTKPDEIVILVKIYKTIYDHR